MKKPRICAAIVNNDLESVKKIEPVVDLLEVRIDLIGNDWPKVVKQLEKPWIGCNRHPDEGGKWNRDEAGRIDELLKAIELGADIIDIELRTADLEGIIPLIKKKAKCLLSFHDFDGTPPLEEMKDIVQRQLDAGADICKIVATARSFEDNLTTLQIIAAFPRIRLVSFAMGAVGLLSRVLCPLAGGDFTYASIERGRESAPGQITVDDMIKIYEIMAF